MSTLSNTRSLCILSMLFNLVVTLITRSYLVFAHLTWMYGVCHVSEWLKLSFRLIVCMCMSKCMGVWYELSNVDMYHCSFWDTHWTSYTRWPRACTHLSLWHDVAKCNPECVRCVSPFLMSSIKLACTRHISRCFYALSLCSLNWDTFLYVHNVWMSWAEWFKAWRNSHVDHLFHSYSSLLFCVDLYCSYVINKKWSVVY